MRRHPELGARILSSRELDDVREWILAHHERPDGTGYPKGLTGEQIPLEASIVAVARRLRGDDQRPRLPARRSAPTRRARSCWTTPAPSSTSDVVEALLRALDREGAPVIR